MPESVGSMILVDGDKELQRALDAMRVKPSNRIIRSALTKASRIVAKIAKKEVKRFGAFESGTLHKSIGVSRIWTVKRTGTIGIVVGPRHGHGRSVTIVAETRKGRIKRGQLTRARAGRTKGPDAKAIARRLGDEYRDPVHYAHLVERGVKKGGRFIAPRPFLASAFMRSRSRAERATLNGLWVAIKREAEKAYRKSKKR